MSKNETAIAIPDEIIMNQIYVIRGQKIMLDRDLAVLYGVETRVLKQAVKRNMKRFPEDFMFEMTSRELENWRSQFVTSNSDRKGLRYSPFCFTEQGVTMLSCILKSDRMTSNAFLKILCSSHLNRKLKSWYRKMRYHQ